MSTTTFSLDVQARARPAAVSAAVEFDAAREPHTWVHGRFKRGGLYVIWWAVCRAGRALGHPVPAPWDLRGTYGLRRKVRAQMETRDDFLFPAPLDFSLGDDPQESPYFSRPLLDAFKESDAEHAELFAGVESEAHYPPADASRRCQEVINRLEAVEATVSELRGELRDMKGGRRVDGLHPGAMDAAAP